MKDKEIVEWIFERENELKHIKESIKNLETNLISKRVELAKGYTK